MEPVSPALTGGFLTTREVGRRRNVIEGTETAVRPLEIYLIIKPGLWNRANVLYTFLSLFFFLTRSKGRDRPLCPRARGGRGPAARILIASRFVAPPLYP